MKAIELSGLHVGKLAHVKFSVLNKDGSPRANGKPKDFFMHITAVHHYPAQSAVNGQAYSRLPMRSSRSKSGYANAYMISAPSVPWHADIELLD